MSGERFRFVNSRATVVDHGPSLRMVTTRFEPLAVVHGVPTYDETAVARARSLGYLTPDDRDAAWAMHREHELVHSVVGEAMGWPWSPTLYFAANRLAPPPGLAPLEERVVFLVQRALNVGRGLIEERRVA